MHIYTALRTVKQDLLSVMLILMITTLFMQSEITLESIQQGLGQNGRKRAYEL